MKFHPWIDCYEVLEIEIDSTEEDIKRAYRLLAGVHHPDKWAHSSSSTREKHSQRMRELNIARDILLSNRAEYNFEYRERQKNAGQPKTEAPHQQQQTYRPPPKQEEPHAQQRSYYTPPKPPPRKNPPKEERKQSDYTPPKQAKPPKKQERPQKAENRTREESSSQPKAKKPEKTRKTRRFSIRKKKEGVTAISLVGELIVTGILSFIPCMIAGLAIGMIFYTAAVAWFGFDQDMATTYVYVSMLGGFWVSSGIFIVIATFTGRVWFTILFPLVYYYVNILLYNAYKGG